MKIAVLPGDGIGREVTAQGVKVLKAVLGREHPDTLTTRANLASWTGPMGDPAARDQYAALLPVLERVLGPQHPDSRTARANLAYWIKRSGTGPGSGTK